MNRKDLEKLFDRYDVYYDEVGLDVRDVRTGRHIGSVHYISGTTGSEVLAVCNSELSTLRQPKLISIGGECSFRNVHELANSLNSDRRLEGKRPASERMLNREFKACAKFDFESCVKLLKAWLDFLFFADGNNELPEDVTDRLNKAGKRHYGKVRKARTSVVAEAPKPYTGPHGWNDAIRALHGPKESDSDEPDATLAPTEKNAPLILGTLKALDANATHEGRHQAVYEHVLKNGPVCRRELVESVSISRVNVTRIIRRLENCGLLIEKPCGIGKHFVALASCGIDVTRVAAAYAVLVMQRTYEEMADKYKSAYGTMP